MFTKEELRQLLKRDNSQAVLRRFEMEGGVDTEELVQAMVQDRDEWRKEQWPRGSK